MIEFNAGSFRGNGTIDKVTTYRDGGLSVHVKVNNTPEAHVLLDNVNKICQVALEVEGAVIKVQGELVNLATYRNGGIQLSLVLPNEPQTGAFCLARVKKEGALAIDFSSTKAKSVESEPAEQPNLEGLGDEEDKD